MTTKLLMPLGLLGLLAGGCATMPTQDYDEYFRQLNPPYFEGTQINMPARPATPANDMINSRGEG